MADHNQTQHSKDSRLSIYFHMGSVFDSNSHVGSNYYHIDLYILQYHILDNTVHVVYGTQLYTNHVHRSIITGISAFLMGRNLNTCLYS